MEYIIVVEESASELEDAINKRLADGWQLQGGVACSDAYDTARDAFFPAWAQAMTKPGSNK